MVDEPETEIEVVDDAQQVQDVDADVSSADDQPLTIKALAEKMGWSEKDKWRGNPDKWIPAEKFLENTQSVNKSLKDQLARVTKMQSQLFAKQKADMEADFERRLREATENGDADEAIKITREMKKANVDNVDHVSEFSSRNPWFNAHPKATDLAIMQAQIIANNGGDVQEQFEAAESAVRKKFPELFDDDLDTPPSKSPPKRPETQGGQRAAAAPRGPKGWNEIPKTARDELESFARLGVPKESLAKEYWGANQ